MKRILASLMLVGLLASCQKKEYRFNEGYVFGTVYHFTYLSGHDFQTEIESELKKFDAALSMFNPQSTLSRINQNGTTGFDLKGHDWVLKVIRESLAITKWSNGAFDITVAPLVNVWGFGFRKSDEVTPARIDSLLQFVGPGKIRLEGSILSKTDASVQLDASAVAKGYACDVVADFLRSKGIHDFMVEIGGEMVVSGSNPKGETWRIGISKPFDDSTSSNQDLEQVIELTGKAVATSGNYRKFYIRNGRKYAHTIDPRTGYPVQHSLLSATILANDCLTADAIATACMVLGADSALQLVEERPDTEALLIVDGGDGKHEIRMTSGMKSFLR